MIVAKRKAFKASQKSPKCFSGKGSGASSACQKNGVSPIKSSKDVDTFSCRERKGSGRKMNVPKTAAMFVYRCAGMISACEIVM